MSQYRSHDVIYDKNESPEGLVFTFRIPKQTHVSNGTSEDKGKCWTSGKQSKFHGAFILCVKARKNEEASYVRVSVTAAAAAPSGSILRTHTHIKQKTNDRDPIAIIMNGTRTHAEMGFTWRLLFQNRYKTTLTAKQTASHVTSS
jgi:hypothetical protein